MLKPTSFSPILAFIGILLYMGKNEKKKGIGTIPVSYTHLDVYKRQRPYCRRHPP